MEKLNVNKEAEAVVEAPIETALPESDAPAAEAVVDSIPADAEDTQSEAVADLEKSDEVSVETEATPADSVEKAAETPEEVEQPDFAKMLGELKGFFSETLVKATEANAAQVSEIKETVESFSKSVNAQITELADKHTALSAAVTEIKGTIDGVQKRVDAVESDTAIKKSSDLGRSEVVTKSNSKWHGAFLGSVNEIFN
jgi:type VI protein secretion system component VasK